MLRCETSWAGSRAAIKMRLDSLHTLHHHWDKVSSLTVGEVVGAVQHRVRGDILVALAVLLLLPRIGGLIAWYRLRRRSHKVHVFDWPLPKVRSA